MKYIASCSFGKDSLATTLLALEHGEPLDEAVFVEVMFDHTRGISGEIPEHIDWIYSTAIPRLAAMGVRTRVLRSERDYMYFFYKCRRGGGDSRANSTASRLEENVLRSETLKSTRCGGIYVVSARKSLNISESPPMSRSGLQGYRVSRTTNLASLARFHSSRSTATRKRWRESYAKATACCRLFTRRAREAAAGSAPTHEFRFSAACAGSTPTYGRS